jgi:hypothetical protein
VLDCILDILYRYIVLILFWNFDRSFHLFLHSDILFTLSEHSCYMSVLQWEIGCCISTKELLGLKQKNPMLYPAGRIWQKYNQCIDQSLYFIRCRIYTSECIRLLQYSTSYPVFTEYCPVLFLDSWQQWRREKFGRKTHMQRALSFGHMYVLVLKPGDANFSPYSRNVYRAVWRTQFLEQILICSGVCLNERNWF